MDPVVFTGLASGIDTRALIEAILAVERRPAERLQERQALFNERKAALESLRSKLKGFGNAVDELSSDQTFRNRTATVSEESILRATPGSGAEQGIFEIEVLDLAAAGRVKSDGVASSSQSLVSDGTITIQSGENELIRVDVSAASGNNSLEAVRDAINSADQGVQASVLFDGADYRLIVRAEETGEANALTITDSTNLALDDVANEVTAAADAQITVDGIDITSSTNSLSDTIPGVTLELLSQTSGTPITVEIAQDDDQIVEAVQKLVGQYNEVINFFNEQDEGGPLGGDSISRQILLQLQNNFIGGVDGISVGGLRSLSSLGVSFDGGNSQASLDAAELREVLEDQFDDVGNLFLTSGNASAFGVTFLSSTADSEAGSYAIEITQAAEKATVLGNALIANITQDEELTISVGSNEVIVNLTDGMSLSEIIDEVNSTLEGAGLGAAASDDGGQLRISTDDFGDLSLSVSSDINGHGSPFRVSSGFTRTASTDTGQDLVGKIGGVDATGNGQTLTAADDGPYGGLQLQVTATAAQISANGGDFGNLDFTRGLLHGLEQSIDSFTRFGDGLINTLTDSIDDQVRTFDDEIARIEERLSRREILLTRTFTAAERAIASLQAQQAQLGSFSFF